MKNIFAFLLAIVMTIILAHPFPLEASQMGLFNMMIIGIPSFVLAMEPNKSMIKGRFLINVFKNALPAGLTDFGALTLLSIIGAQRGIPDAELSTMACIIVTFVGLMMLYKLAHPLNKLRIALIICMIAGFSVGWATIGELIYGLSSLRGETIWITIIFCLASAPVMLALSMLTRNKKN
jgi:cation-transporting ATPase E